MKCCPYCAEEIQDAAIKCKHCGEFLTVGGENGRPRKSGPWYFHAAFILLMLASIGPLALPLIWWHPRLSNGRKIGITVIVLVLTWLLVQATVTSLQMLRETYNELLQSM